MWHTGLHSLNGSLTQYEGIVSVSWNQLRRNKQNGCRQTFMLECYGDSRQHFQDLDLWIVEYIKLNIVDILSLSAKLVTGHYEHKCETLNLSTSH